MPDPKFEGCWNCGAKGHSRKECKKIKALIKENGGKIPEGYEGAYEKEEKVSAQSHCSYPRSRGG